MTIPVQPFDVIVVGKGNAALQRAWGIAASQVSGLVRNFGTMTKPFHAGRAARSLGARRAERLLALRCERLPDIGKLSKATVPAAAR